MPKTTQVPGAQLVQTIENALLKLRNVNKVMQVTVVDVPGNTQVIAAKIAVPAQLQMSQVSALLAVAELRIRELAPAAQHVFITPDVYFDDAATASTSAIVTLSYD